MGGCQNYDPFLGYPKYWVPYYNRDPKGDHNSVCWRIQLIVNYIIFTDCFSRCVISSVEECVKQPPIKFLCRFQLAMWDVTNGQYAKSCESGIMGESGVQLYGP